MKKKDVMLICAMANAVLLCSLFVVGVMTPGKKIELVDAIDKTKPAMLQVQPILAESEEDLSPTIRKNETIVYQLPQIQKAKIEEPVLPSPAQEIFEKIVVVKKGDTLEAISRREKISVEKIIGLNDLKSPLLKIGQNLKMPSEDPQEVASKVETKSNVPPVEKPIVIKNNSEKHYTVKVGDNPWTIAMKHHMKVKDLLQLNSLDDKSARKIKPGDKLRVR